MKPFDSIEYNKLCAKFMGLTVIPVGTYSIGSIRHPEISEAFLKYDSDWNFIMEVVEKIEKECGVSIVGGPVKKPTCVIYLGNLKAKSGQGNSKKEAVVQAIWEFLNWYNEQSK